MKRAVIACVMVAFLPTGFAHADEAVLAPLKSIYQGDMMREEEPFTKRLAALYDAAVKRSEEIESPVSGLDFDYAVNGQDFEDGLIASVKYEVNAETAESAEVKVTFQNFDMQTLKYNLAKEDGAWLVDDVKCMSPDCDWLLSALYEQGAVEPE